MKTTHDGSHGESCFGCRIRTVSFGYRYGRVSWHGDHPDGRTIREREKTMIADARAMGYEPERVR